MRKKLCLVFNAPPHYREAIYKALDNEYNCDWYFGESHDDIRVMDISGLENVSYYKIYGYRSRLYWQVGLISLLFKRKYQKYLLLSEVRSISLWVFILIKSIFFRKKNIYGWSHGLYGRENKLRKFLERWKTNNMTKLFVYNERARQLYIKIGVNPEKVITIYNSLDYESQLQLRNTICKSGIYYEHFGNNYPTIIFIGRLTKEKKLSWLLEAIKELQNKGKKLNVVFVGDGKDKTHLESYANRFGVSAWFYGACYNEKDNAELIYNADLCVSPGNVGLTAIHSMMFGTPVITNDDLSHQGPEFEIIKSGKTGDFFKNGDINSLAEVIENWLKTHNNRESVRKECFDEIDSNWNPRNQLAIFKANI